MLKKVLFLIGLACSPVAQAERPNVLFILADDLGYGGLHCFGTPWLWKIEEEQTLEEVLRSPPKKIVVTKGGKPRGGEAICFSRDKPHLFAVYDGKKKNRPLHGYPALSGVR